MTNTHSTTHFVIRIENKNGPHGLPGTGPWGKIEMINSSPCFTSAEIDSTIEGLIWELETLKTKAKSTFTGLKQQRKS